MDHSDKLLVTMANGIKRITFNRPDRRNAADTEVFALLRAAFEAASEDESRVIVLTGTGDAFCAGADLQARDEHDITNKDITEELRATINRTILAMRALPKPIIARVHGAAAGVGCNFALACDLIFTSEEARFGQVFVKIGLAPDGGGTFFLPRAVGYVKAFELMATGDIIGAREALALGLINQVFPLAELDQAVDQMAVRLAASPPVALAMIKQGLNVGQQSDLAAALDNEAVNQGRCARSRDFAEGVRAFLEKRKPNFQGK